MSEQLSASTHALMELMTLAAIDPNDAIQRLLGVDQQFQGDIHYWSFRPGILINAGSTLGDMELVREGVRDLESVIKGLPEPPFEWLNALYYNLGNGYYELALQDRRNGTHDPDNPLLQRVKSAFRKAVDHLDYMVSPSQAAQTFTNLGNALSLCGRHYEALLAYDTALSYVPDHTMALGNKGIELERYAFLAQEQSLVTLGEAYELCSLAADDRTLDEQGLAYAREVFQQHADQLRPFYEEEGGELLDRVRQQEPSTGDHSKAENVHHWFYAENGLYLNLCVHDWYCSAKYSDNLFFSYVAPIDDVHRFDRLGRYFNQIKEDYATSRYILVEATNPSQERNGISRISNYADLLEYAEYGLDHGMLKLALGSAYNILDKIAVFLKWELDIPIDEGRVHFRSFWNDPKTQTLRHQIAGTNDPSLHALYDLSLDLGETEFKRMTELRRQVTHRHLVVHDWIFMVGENSNEEEHILTSELVAETIKVLKMAKSAIIYLASYLSYKATRQELESTSLIPSLPIVRQEDFR